jgi:hypothetical protein
MLGSVKWSEELVASYELGASALGGRALREKARHWRGSVRIAASCGHLFAAVTVACLVTGWEQHLFGTEVDCDRGVRTVAEYGLTGGIGTTFRPSQRFLFHELLGFG